MNINGSPATGGLRRALDRLRHGFDGVLFAPGDAEYDAARRVWNVDVVREPAVIARPRTIAAVQTTVRFALKHDLPIAVRGGGHGMAGYGTADGALVIDLQKLTGVGVDASTRTAVAGAGLTWGVMDEATQRHGLAVTGADAPMVGVSGVAIGGGLGWLHRLAGLTCDNLLGAGVVTADGELLRVSREQHPELFWALRGGGGNFGVVTGFRFRLHRVRELMAGVVVHPLEKGREVLRFYQDLCAGVPFETALRLTLMKAPPGPFIPRELHGRPVVMVGVVAYGAPDDTARMLGPIRDFGPPAVDGIRPMSYLELQQPPGRFPARQRAYGHSAFLGPLDERVIDTLLNATADLPSPMAMIQVQQMGGVISEVTSDATPFFHRQAAHHLAVNALAPHDDPACELIPWTTATAEAITPHALGGPYVNFVTGGESAADVRGAYHARTYSRLAEIKATYDPGNVFRFNANIAPAAAPSGLAAGRG